MLVFDILFPGVGEEGCEGVVPVVDCFDEEEGEDAEVDEDHAELVEL